MPWSRGTLYDRPATTGRPFAIGAAVVVLLLLGWFGYSKIFGGTDCREPYCESSRKIAPPPGYELASKIFIRNEKAGEQPPGSVVVVRQLPLLKPTTDSRNLSLYRYSEETKTWEPAAAALLDPQGTFVSASLPDAPPVLAVLRRLSAAGHVVAYLEHKANLHPDAVGRVTIVHTLDFQPTADGTIRGDPSPAKPDGQTAWYPVISATAGDKTNVFVEAILASPASRSNHVQQVVKKVNDLKLAGIGIRYLDLRADQRNSLTLFVGELAQQLHSGGKVLTLTLPCPIRTQDRIDEGAYDWAELAKSADVVAMAPCRDQATFRRDVPDILGYLTKAVPPSKLVMTVTPYATEKSNDGLHPLSLTEAMSLASKLSVQTSPGEKLTTNSNVNIVGVNIDRSEGLTGVVWDTAAACVAFTYKLNGGRTVWVENFFSIGFKLEFVSQFQLGGVAVEDASDNVYLGNIWPALIPFISSGQPVLMQPNGNDLVPRWKASKGSLEEGAQGKGIARWLTPSEPGTYTLSLTLSDGVALFENEIAVNVQPRDPRSPVPGTPAASPTPG